MTFRDKPWPEGTPCWVDVFVDDSHRAAGFYRNLFGWSFTDQGEEFDHFLMMTLDGRAVADIAPKPPEMADSPSVWTTYIAVDNADEVAERITKADGKIVLPPVTVGSHGRYVVVADPAGAVFGLWQAGGYYGAQVTNVAGAMIWSDCFSQDHEASKAFYTSVFGYTLGEAPSSDGTYATLELGGRPVGGIGVSGADVPSHWTVTFGVADTDAAVAKVAELGGMLRRAPADTAYGRFASVADDQGVTFGVISVG